MIINELQFHTLRAGDTRKLLTFKMRCYRRILKVYGENFSKKPQDTATERHSVINKTKDNAAVQSYLQD